MKILSRAEAAELRQLWTDSPRTPWLSRRSFMTKGKPLTGKLLQHFLAADARVGEIAQRIREIQGE